MSDFCNIPFEMINSITKYPSIPTLHKMGERGILTEEALPIPEGTIIATEKIDGANARIIVSSDGDYLIGSRENLLYAKGDRIGDPSMGIAAALRPVADGIAKADVKLGAQGVLAIYGEVFGGRTTASKSYGPMVHFRVFDAFWFRPGLCANFADVREVSLWREQGCQEFVPLTSLVPLCEQLDLKMVPTISDFPSGSLEATHEWFQKRSMQTECGDKAGPAEGIVIRSMDRKFIAKLRVDDYAKAARLLHRSRIAREVADEDARIAATQFRQMKK